MSVGTRQRETERGRRADRGGLADEGGRQGGRGGRQGGGRQGGKERKDRRTDWPTAGETEAERQGGVVCGITFPSVFVLGFCCIFHSSYFSIRSVENSTKAFSFPK